ncbi:glycosyltransferase family 2 protein [Iningainema tapete]|uniref:Glycosyltransferase family 2 protein n=1 Tax=Iningainema tapete BLCC-T55 TaxID=2748662 RepID=A0A8J6XK22_9CYAN|nr:glycosyltransferase family 2 protein [Iningainema tapete]MBD2778355.1 glycosyltransferase family 2 protein [Iningainema tapete BLCC-T55]
MNPTFTIVIPAYNAAQYLPETLESVLAQTYENFEVLIINDGSTDNTVEIVEQYSQKDSRVKLISQINQGVAIARNTGIAMAQGEFIAFLDSDDLWYPDKLATHLEHFKSCSELGISFARVEFVTFDNKPTGQLSHSRLKNLQPLHFYYENPIITPSNAVISRKVFESVEGFDKSLSGTEDAELFLRVNYSGWKAEGINKVLIRYRTSLGGVSSKLYKMEEDWNRFNEKIQTYAPDLINQHYNQAKAIFLRYLARRTLRLRLSSQIGVELMNRALRAHAQIIFQEPRRTLLTMLAVYSTHLLSLFKFNKSLN